jgi:hypothetical protein
MKICIVIPVLIHLAFSADIQTEKSLNQQTIDNLFRSIEYHLGQTYGPCNCQFLLQKKYLLDTLPLNNSAISVLRRDVFLSRLDSALKTCQKTEKLEEKCIPDSKYLVPDKSCSNCTAYINNLKMYLKQIDNDALNGESKVTSYDSRRWFWSYFADAASCATCNSSTFLLSESEIFEKVFLGSFVTSQWNSDKFRTAFSSYSTDSLVAFIHSLKNGNDSLVIKLLSLKNPDSLRVILGQLLDEDPEIYGILSQLLAYREILLFITKNEKKHEAFQQTMRMYHEHISKGMKNGYISIENLHFLMRSIDSLMNHDIQNRPIGILPFWRKSNKSLTVNESKNWAAMIKGFNSELGDFFNPVFINVEKNHLELFKKKFNNIWKKRKSDKSMADLIPPFFQNKETIPLFLLAGRYYRKGDGRVCLELTVIETTYGSVPVHMVLYPDISSESCVASGKNIVKKVISGLQEYVNLMKITAIAANKPLSEITANDFKAFSILEEDLSLIAQTKLSGEIVKVEKSDYWKFKIDEEITLSSNDDDSDNVLTILQNYRSNLSTYLEKQFKGKLTEVSSAGSEKKCLIIRIQQHTYDSARIELYINDRFLLAQPLALTDIEKGENKIFKIFRNYINAILLENPLQESFRECCDKTKREPDKHNSSLNLSYALPSLLAGGTSQLLISSRLNPYKPTWRDALGWSFFIIDAVLLWSAWNTDKKAMESFGVTQLRNRDILLCVAGIVNITSSTIAVFDILSNRKN